MTTEAVATTPPPALENTIQDAIESLFADKAAAEPAKVDPPAEQTEATDQVASETPAEKPAEPAKAPEPVTTSATDYALEIAKVRKRMAAVDARAATAKKPPSADAIARAAAIEAAGGDPMKAFEAAGLDLAAVVQAYEKQVAQSGDYPDPLAREVKSLAEKVAHYEALQQAAEETQSTKEFFAAADQMVKASGSHEYVAAHGDEARELVKRLVIKAGEKGEVLPLGEALDMVEAHYTKLHDVGAKTEKLKSKFQSAPAPKRPGIGQAPTAGAAPVTQTKPRTVQDVINTEIDALLG